MVSKGFPVNAEGTRCHFRQHLCLRLFEKTKGRLEREVAYLQVKTVFLRTAMGRGLNEADLDSRTKTQLVQELRTQYPLDALLQGAGLPRSTYYYHLRMAQ